jgi:hypothetical protein
MKLSKCVYGVLVYNESLGIGMVKGITNNVPDAEGIIRSEPVRALPLVEWACGHTCGVNAANIEIYKENQSGVI